MFCCSFDKVLEVSRERPRELPTSFRDAYVPQLNFGLSRRRSLSGQGVQSGEESLGVQGAWASQLAFPPRAKAKGRASCNYLTYISVLHIALTLQHVTRRLLIVCLFSITWDIQLRSTIATWQVRYGHRKRRSTSRSSCDSIPCAVVDFCGLEVLCQAFYEESVQHWWLACRRFSCMIELPLVRGCHWLRHRSPSPFFAPLFTQVQESALENISTICQRKIFQEPWW